MVRFTPLGDFERFADLIHELPGFICFGSPGQESDNRGHDIISALPDQTFRVDSHVDAETQLGVVLQAIRDAVDHNTIDLKDLSGLPFIPPFIGGLAGSLDYELGYHLQPGLTALRKARTAPHENLLSVGHYSWAAIREIRTGRTGLFWHPSCPDETRRRITSLAERCVSGSPGTETFRMTSPFVAEVSAATHRSNVDRILAYLNAGDAYQVNLSQRFTGHYQGNPWYAFKELTKAHHASFAAYYDNGGTQVLSLSPERFILAEKDRITTQPIKGTRPRGATPEQDEQLRRELETSEKDRAENLMIVDLLRNDLGRQCVTGSVHVDELFRVESHPNVHHLVSTISGCLRPDLTPLELLLSAFPGGSITGAPKRRAMEIIHELEPHQRGPYCGSLFYISHHGRMDSNIAIRTLRCSEGLIECWGGGGVVADSDPQEEYEESCVKVKRLMEIVESLH